MIAPWWKFSVDAAMLAVEAQGVIAMRMTTLALGRGTHAENTLLVTEKATAFLLGRAVGQAASAAATTQSGSGS